MANHGLSRMPGYLFLGTIVLLYTCALLPELLPAGEVSNLRNFFLGSGGLLNIGIGALFILTPIAWAIGILLDGVQAWLGAVFRDVVAPVEESFAERTPASSYRLAYLLMTGALSLAIWMATGLWGFLLLLWLMALGVRPGDTYKTLRRDYETLDPRNEPTVLPAHGQLLHRSRQAVLRCVLAGLFLQKTHLRYAGARRDSHRYASNATPKDLEPHATPWSSATANLALLFAILGVIGLAGLAPQPKLEYVNDHWILLHVLAAAFLARMTYQNGLLELETAYRRMDLLKPEQLQSRAEPNSPSTPVVKPTRKSASKSAPREAAKRVRATQVTQTTPKPKATSRKQAKKATKRAKAKRSAKKTKTGAAR